MTIELDFDEKPKREFLWFKKINDYFGEHDRKFMQRGSYQLSEAKDGIWAPSNLFAVYQAFGKFDLGNCKHFLDLGSGDGRVVFVASLFTRASGIDSDENFHEKAMNHKEALGIKTIFINKDILQHDLSNYDVFFMYPGESFIQEFVEKLKKEARGKRLIIYNKIYTPDKHFKRTRTVFFDNMPIMEFLIE